MFPCFSLCICVSYYSLDHTNSIFFCHLLLLCDFCFSLRFHWILAIYLTTLLLLIYCNHRGFFFPFSYSHSKMNDYLTSNFSSSSWNINTFLGFTFPYFSFFNNLIYFLSIILYLCLLHAISFSFSHYYALKILCLPQSFLLKVRHIWRAMFIETWIKILHISLHYS